MAGLDLRPLSTGEILDRTFSLYRRHFLLFIGICAVPRVLVLGLALLQTSFTSLPSVSVDHLVGSASDGILAVLVVVASLIAYLFSQAGCTVAISELYLGRAASITDSLRRATDDIGFLFGVAFLNGLAVGAASLLLVIPGIYVACRLLVCVPSAVIEKRSPRESLSRSFELTRDYAGRAFLILALSLVVSFAAQFLLAAPFVVALAASGTNPAIVRFWLAMNQVAASVAVILVTPIMMIATAIYYYDLRVRKEAFDLQFMMNPDVQRTPATGITSLLS